MENYITIDQSIFTRIAMLTVDKTTGDRGYTIVYPCVGMMALFGSKEVNYVRAFAQTLGVELSEYLGDMAWRGLQDMSDDPVRAAARDSAIVPIDYSRFSEVAVAEVSGGNIRGGLIMNSNPATADNALNTVAGGTIGKENAHVSAAEAAAVIEEHLKTHHGVAILDTAALEEAGVLERVDEGTHTIH